MKRNFLTIAWVASAVALGWLGPQRQRRKRSCPRVSQVVSLEASPAEVTLATPYAYAQVLVTAQLAGGDRMDVTRMVEPTVSGDLATVSPTGVVRAKMDGDGQITYAVGGQVDRGAAEDQRTEGRLHRQLRPRRDARHVQDGLQRRHVPRLAQRQERLQAVAARLRPAVRSSRVDRRHRQSPHQSRGARPEPDAAEARGRHSARRRRGDPAGPAVLRVDPLLDRAAA